MMQEQSFAGEPMTRGRPPGAERVQDETTDAAGQDAVSILTRERYPLVQYHFVEFITTHLADCSRTFDGDLQQMLVLAIIGQVYLRAYLDASPAAGQPPKIVPVTASITASRIADVTGIPRETVRRKLAALERRGWIERTGDAGWRLAVQEGKSAARADLAALDQRGMERMARILAALKAYLQ